jgi:hypothetical protein
MPQNRAEAVQALESGGAAMKIRVVGRTNGVVYWVIEPKKGK